MDLKKLDNPVWHALSETHQKFAISYPNIKFYHPDYCQFGGIAKNENISNHLEAYSRLSQDFFIVGDVPELPDQLMILKELVCLQMIIDREISIKKQNPIHLLGTEHKEALFELVNLVQPGYFRTKTALLGNYYGIFQNGELIAAAGERMKMHELTEVSAIVTHPSHTGKGYAKQLTAHVVNKIFSKNKQPFLHVLETNVSAIGLYEKLGFETRRKISFWKIVRI